MNKTVVVKFECNGGSLVKPLTIENGFMIRVPETSKMGYDFSGWYKDVELKEIFNANKIIEKNLTLYAKWANYAPKKFINDISIYTNLSNVVKDYQEIYGNDNKEVILESDKIKEERERIEKSSFIKSLNNQFEIENVKYKQISLELHKVELKKEKIKEKMDKKVQRKGEEKSRKIIALYNEVLKEEGEIQTKYQSVVRTLDDIESRYEKFASENR